jgi:hypothetical protein
MTAREHHCLRITEHPVTPGTDEVQVALRAFGEEMHGKAYGTNKFTRSHTLKNGRMWDLGGTGGKTEVHYAYLHTHKGLTPWKLFRGRANTAQDNYFCRCAPTLYCYLCRELKLHDFTIPTSPPDPISPTDSSNPIKLTHTNFQHYF